MMGGTLSTKVCLIQRPKCDFYETMFQCPKMPRRGNTSVERGDQNSPKLRMERHLLAFTQIFCNNKYL